MTTNHTDTSHRGTSPINTSDLAEGDSRIRVRIGGQTLDMNVDVLEYTHDGHVVVRSETETDHMWTKMWVRLGDRVDLVAEAATDDEFEGL